jgi:osmotically-inducible protein OsmY
VTLQGTVSSEEQKHLAAQAVMQLSGVKRVVNLLEVKP